MKKIFQSKGVFLNDLLEKTALSLAKQFHGRRSKTAWLNHSRSRFGFWLKRVRKIAFNPEKSIAKYERGDRETNSKVFRNQKAYLGKETEQNFPLQFQQQLLVAIINSKSFGCSHDRIRQRNLCLRTKGVKLVCLICIVLAL